jgi:peptide/nickel transport system permease protein
MAADTTGGPIVPGVSMAVGSGQPGALSEVVWAERGGAPDLIGANGAVGGDPGLSPNGNGGGSLTTPSGGEAGHSGSIWRLIFRVFIENKLAVVGVAIVLLMVLFCFVGPLIYTRNTTFATYNITIAPDGKYPLGTDGNGIDVLAGLMAAGQNSLEVGLVAAVIATFVGVIWGAVAGFFGGIVDTIMMRIVDVLLAIPVLLLLIVLAVLFSPGKWVICLIIGFVAWQVPSRLVRGETLSLRTREYVQAVRVMGGSGRRIVMRHIIPNAIGTIIVNATFQVADAILFLAALGFLGLGLHFPSDDWGSMLSNGAYYIYNGDWWLIIPPGLCIVLVVVAFNFIGDALRDSLEVRLQRR